MIKSRTWHCKPTLVIAHSKQITSTCTSLGWITILSKLISKWIWIFSSTSILDEFLAMIASSWLLVAWYTSIFKHKTNTKVSSKNVPIEKCIQWFCSLTVWISGKRAAFKWSIYFNGNSWFVNLWHLKFILFIDSFPISPLYQPASHAN